MPTLDVAVNVEKAVSSLTRMERSLEKVIGRFDRTDRAVVRSEKTLKRFGGTAARAGNQIRGMLGAFGGAIGARGLVRTVDSFQSLQNRMRVVTASSAQLQARFSQVFDIAQRTRQGLEGLVTLYQRTAQAQDDLGASSSRMLTFIERVAQGLTIQGTSAATARGALLQLSQGLGSVVFRAEEFTSIMEGARPIVIAVAKGLDRASGSVSRLRQLVINGEVSNRDFFDSFLKGSDDIADQFDRTTVTISQASQRLSNEFTIAAGAIGEKGLSGSIVSLIDFVTLGVKSFRDFEGGLTAVEQKARGLIIVLGAVGLTGVLAGIAVFLSPLGLLAVGVAALVGAFVAWETATNTISQSHRELNEELANMSLTVSSLGDEYVTLAANGNAAAAAAIKLDAITTITAKRAELLTKRGPLQRTVDEQRRARRPSGLGALFAGASAGEAGPQTEAAQELRATNQALALLTQQLKDAESDTGAFRIPQGPPPPSVTGARPGEGPSEKQQKAATTLASYLHQLDIATEMSKLSAEAAEQLAAGQRAVAIVQRGGIDLTIEQTQSLIAETAARVEARQAIEASKANAAAAAAERDNRIAQFSGDVALSVTDSMRQALFDSDADLKEIMKGFALRLTDALAEALIFKPIENAIKSLFTAAFAGSVAAADGMAIGGGGRPIPFALGGALSGSGGIVSTPTTFGLSGGRTGVAGEAGPEAILPLKRGKGGKLGVTGTGGGGGGMVTITNNFVVQNDSHLRRTVKQVSESQRRISGTRT